jgi:hypothetical protein
MLTITRDLFSETFRVLRDCGKMVNECQVLWLSAHAAPDSILTVRHSTHDSTGGGVEVDSVWLNTLWRELRSSSLSIRAQIHTHPGMAFHSKTDDAFPIVGSPGFISIVVPNFATHGPTLRGLYATSITPSGKWQELPITEVLQVL